MEKPNCELEELWSLATSANRLDRDRSLQMADTAMAGDDGEGRHRLRALLADKCAVIAGSETSWETKLGYLLLAEKTCKQQGEAEALSEALTQTCVRLLIHDEVRVRTASGVVLGVLCASLGSTVYEGVKDKLLNMIKSDLERAPPENQHPQESKASNVLHDTAGWRHLETSMLCLQRMVEGCGEAFRPYLDQELLDLVFSSLKHTNRFVRETGHATVAALVASEALVNSDGGIDSAIGAQLAAHISEGMADNWSQVRLAASVACRRFLACLETEERREAYFPQLLPVLCLNRYYMAEGVRIYCQTTWRQLVGVRGRALVEQHLESVVAFYVRSISADNHAVREAACHCIAELAAKLSSAVVRSHVRGLLTVLLEAFADDSWPVRDTACVAAGKFVAHYPDECREQLSKLKPLMVTNLRDPISSVRQGAALALSSAAKTYPDELVDDLGKFIKEGLLGLKDQPAESARYSDLFPERADFGVAKRMRDNDPSLHENQQMYSCGSLAPKMGRGGCSDAKFRKESEPWELADGCVHLLAELLSESSKLGEDHRLLLAPLVEDVASACGIRHYTMHYSFMETAMKRLPDLARGLGKRPFKRHLESFMEPLFYSCECEHALARAAAVATTGFLSQWLGPNIFRGRVEQMHARYLSTLDSVLTEPMDVSHPPTQNVEGISIPGSTGCGRLEFTPSLGGTPT